MSLSEVAVYLGVPEATLYRWRTRGDGPRGLRVGRHVRYQPQDVRDWITSRLETTGTGAA